LPIDEHGLDNGSDITDQATLVVAMQVLLGEAQSIRKPMEFNLMNYRYFDTDDLFADNIVVKMYFDGQSHQSGNQRVWTVCHNPEHGRGCVKYRFLKELILLIAPKS